MEQQITRKYFFLLIFLLGAVLTTLLFWPFLKIVILSLALSIVLSPLYLFLKKYLKVPWVASFLSVLCFIIILCVPLFFIGTVVYKQSQELSLWVTSHGGLDNITSIFNHSVDKFFPGGSINLADGIANITGGISSSIGNAFRATLSTFFSLLLVILSMFYFFKDGQKWKQSLMKLNPLSEEGGKKIVDKFTKSVNGIIKGYLLIATAQGLLMGIGLHIFGVPNAALWGVIAGIASLIPTVGTALVAVPAIAFLIIFEKTGSAIGLGIWAVALVGSIDNLLNPIVVGKKIDLHPMVVLFSVLGGIALMGPLGILIGPLIISLMHSIISVYKTEITN